LRKHSQAALISVDLRKIILVTSQFFAFSHKLGQAKTYRILMRGAANGMAKRPDEVFAHPEHGG